MIKNWNKQSILNDLQKIYYATTDPHMDGFTTWGCKQDLWEIKFALDDMLHRCPSYEPETEWLREQEAEKIVRILKQ